MSSSQALSRLTLGVAATATVTSASAAIVVFDIPDTTYDTYNTFGILTLSGINPQSATYQIGSEGGRPAFVIGTDYDVFGAYGLDVSPANFLTSAGNPIDANLGFTSYMLFPPSSVPNGIVYLGIKLTNGADIHYGWFEINSTDGPLNGQDIFTFTRFAFNDIAGQSILAGQTTAIPEASTLGFAGGLFGLVAAAHLRRRKFKQAAASDKFLALAAGEKLN